MTTVAWWQATSGIAGDMALASLVDAGADLGAVGAALSSLPVGGWSLDGERVLRAGLAATRVHVRAADDGIHRRHVDIVDIVGSAPLPARAQRRALDVFARLAEVESRLHGVDPADVHFHEVGGVDAIVDVVGTCVALELLGVDRVWAAPVAQGHGTVRSAHGLLPVPAPAVVELLTGAPTFGVDLPFELTTPTGAALLATLAEGWGPMPAMTVTAAGYGAGSREIEGRPNAVQVVVGTAAEVAPGPGQEVVLLEANLDDVTGEVLAHAVARLLDTGAHDAWITPVLGKKGRPAHLLAALADPSAEEAVRAVLVAETGTLGVRRTTATRWVAPRTFVQVDVDGRPVRVKRSAVRSKAEHDDVAAAAVALGLPAREVARRAERAAELLVDEI